MQRTLLFIFAIFGLSSLQLQAQSSADGSLTVEPASDGFYIWNDLYEEPYQWDVEYGAPGFAENTGTLIANINQMVIMVYTNPFLQYDFRIRLRDASNVPGPWMETVITDSCANVAYDIGYAFNFDIHFSGECWGAYGTPTAEGTGINHSQTYYHGESGQSISLSSDEYPGHTAVLVTPKLQNLGNDKKISFWVRNYEVSGLKVGTITNPFDFTTFHLIQEIPEQDWEGQWEKVTVNLTGYNGTDQYIAIQYKRPTDEDSNYSIYLDDFEYSEGLNCVQVTDASVTNINSNNGTAQLNFTSPTQTEWEVSVKKTGQNYYYEHYYTTTSNPFIIENLTGGSTYEVKIRAVCGPDYYTEWTTIPNITMTCEGLTTGYSTSFGEESELEPCWSHIGPEDSLFNVNSVTANTTDVLLPKSSKKFVWMRNFFGEDPLATYFISPYFDDIDTSKRISFYLVSRSISFEDNASSLTVGTVADPSDMSTFQALQTIMPDEMSEITNLTEQGDYWKQHTIYFNDFQNTGSHHYIVLRHDNLAAQNDLYIDNFIYENAPDCVEPLYPEMVDSSHDEATLTWDDVATPETWQIEYGAPGFIPGTGTIVEAGSNPFTITNIPLDDTEFEFYVRSQCEDGYSSWSDTGYFRTRCIGVTIGYTHTFEDDEINEINSCWTALTPMPEDNYWTPQTFINTTSTETSPNYHAYSGTNAIRMFNELYAPDPDVSQKTILVSPQLMELDQNKTFTFQMYCVSNPTASPTEIIIGTLSNPDDYTTFTPYQTITDAFENEDQWKEYVINFTTYTGNDQYIGIRQAEVNDRQVIFLDDFKYEVVGCTTPAFLTAAQSGEDQVTVGWNSNNDLNPPTEWQIEYGEDNFTPGTGIVVNATTNPFILEDLDLNTIYQYRVRNFCNNSYGDWSDLYTFKVTCHFTAPFYENFDQYANDVITPDGFCWTQHNSLVSRVKEFCLEEVNSCDNSIELSASFFDEQGMMISPYLADFDSTKKIKFYMKNAWETNPPQIMVGTVINPMDPATFTPYQAIEIINNGWGHEYEVDFSGYTGNAKHFAFKYNDDFYESPVYIDDIHYMATGSCPNPLNAWPYNINEDSATIIWDAIDNAEGWEIEYGEAGFTQGTGTTVTADSNEKLIDGLIVSTQYEYYIRSICENSQSIWIGPKAFTTTCVATALPWTEDFNTMEQYGEDILPDCFKIIFDNGTITSHNSTVAFPGDDGYSPDNQLSGFGDTSFVHIMSTGHIMTPQFYLTAGTTYKFSFMARKAHELQEYAIAVSAVRGNTYQAIEAQLDKNGTMIESEYQELAYEFTPLISGDYSFYMNFYYDFAVDIIIDKIQLQEGYVNIVSSEVTYDFESGLSEDLVDENSENTSISIIELEDNSVLFMEGGIDDNDWIAGTDWRGPQASNNLWINNPNSITKLNMKIDPSAMENLYLAFDLKQTANEPFQSAFRVVVNGTKLGDVIIPATLNSDSFINHEYDLTPFIGNDIYLSLQHIGKSRLGTGDNAFLDNITLSGEVMENDNNFEFTDFYAFPNPTTNTLTLKNSVPISTVELYSIQGQKLFIQNYNEPEINLDLSGYSSGIYLLKAHCNKKVKIFRIVKD